jgi:hypothetical protein
MVWSSGIKQFSEDALKHSNELQGESQMTKPNFINVTKYILHDKTYDLFIDFDNAKIINPKYVYEYQCLRLNINGENVDFQTSAAAMEFLAQYINLVCPVKSE